MFDSFLVIASISTRSDVFLDEGMEFRLNPRLKTVAKAKKPNSTHFHDRPSVPFAASAETLRLCSRNSVSKPSLIRSIIFAMSIRHAFLNLAR